jgi:hypothetical protein
MGGRAKRSQGSKIKDAYDVMLYKTRKGFVGSEAT